MSKTPTKERPTLMPLMQSRPCSESECPSLTPYGISKDGNPFEAKCKAHLPDNIIQEYWTERMLLAVQGGKIETARLFLRRVTAEARQEGYSRCASIADVSAQGADTAYSHPDVARGAKDMAQQIARRIRLGDKS